jgi:hypothetical protein
MEASIAARIQGSQPAVHAEQRWGLGFRALGIES